MSKSEEKRVPELRFKGFTENWEQRKLGDISLKVKEKNIKRIHETTFTNSAEHGIITQRDFFDKDITNTKNINNYFVVRPDDFVYNPRISNLAPVGPIKRNKLAKTGIMSPLYYVFRLKEADPSFLEHFFSGSHWHKFMYYNGDTGARSDRFAIKNSIFERMPISSPVEDEQVKVGELLDALDKYINLHQRKLEILQNNKKSLLQKMFPKKGEKIPEIRFPGFTDAWEQRKVSELFKVTRGNVLAVNKTVKIKTEQMQYPVYSSQTLNDGLMGYYNEFLFDTAITWTTDGANAGTVKFRRGKFYSTNVNGVLLSDKGYACKAVAESLNLVAWKHVSKVGNPKLMNNVMSGIVISLPSDIDELNMISNFLDQLDNLITLHQQKVDALSQIKKDYLRKLFI